MAKTYTRKTVLESIPENNDNVKDFVELCEWKNGLGFDITIGSHGVNTMSLTYEEFAIVEKLVDRLNTQ